LEEDELTETMLGSPLNMAPEGKNLSPLWNLDFLRKLLFFLINIPLKIQFFKIHWFT
jgi:hypothetical protein